VLQPSLGSTQSDWYQGTADAIYQNVIHLRRRRVDHVLVLSGDHIYKMDYNALYAFHETSRASVTVAVTEVPAEAVSSFGILEADRHGRVTGFKEKPKRADSRLASMGVYLFDRLALVRWLAEDAATPGSGHDFGKDILPRLVARGEHVFAYRFSGYWQDVGTLDSYYQTNLDFLSDHPPLDLADPDWVIHTQSADRPPVRIGRGGKATRSFVANGCRIGGEVEHSMLFPGVTVASGAVVRDSIVMQDAVVGRGAVVDHAILDKEVHVGEGALVGAGDALTPNRSCPDHLSSGLLVVGKAARLPRDLRVGRNARIGAYVTEQDFTGDVPGGGVVDGPQSMH
jgi:glucose-1-phosphate adenylyltransferase